MDGDWREAAEPDAESPNTERRLLRLALGTGEAGMGVEDGDCC